MKRQFTALLSTAIFFIGNGCTNSNGTKEQYQSYKAINTNLVKSVEANGSIRIFDSVVVHAPVSGRIEKMLVTEGDHVEKGQKIAILSSKTRANFLDHAADKGEKERKYWEQQILPVSAYSPVSGKVLKVYALEGDQARKLANLSLGTIIKADVDETDIPKVFKGQPVKIIFDVGDKAHLEGKVTKISLTSHTVNNVNVYGIQISWPEEDEKALPFEVRIGMSVTLHLEVARKDNALALPTNAVNGFTNAKFQVFNNLLEPLEIQLGDNYDGLVEVVSGLKAGQVIKVPAFTNPSDNRRDTPFLSNKK